MINHHTNFHNILHSRYPLDHSLVRLVLHPINDPVGGEVDVLEAVFAGLSTWEAFPIRPRLVPTRARTDKIACQSRDTTWHVEWDAKS